MQGYELTERGKIAIAVFLAILLIVLAVILAIRVWNGSGSPFDNQRQPAETDHVYNPPDISDTPIPEGDDTSPEENQNNENGEQGSFDPPQEPTEEPEEEHVEEPDGEPKEEPTEEPEDSSEDEKSQEEASDGQAATTGAASINRSAGTMTFRFSPSSQDSLDDDTVAMISDFLDSPRNTANSQITVSIPQLSETETAKIISAVTDAFAEHGVAQRSLAFTIYRLNSSNNSYEIRLSFSQATSRK